jgi:Ni/Co efflux regulator RcnB
MAKKAITTVAQASSCAAKLANGQSCTQAEMKATIRLLNAALNTARSTARMAKKEAKEAKSMIQQLLNRIGL